MAGPVLDAFVPAFEAAIADRLIAVRSMVNEAATLSGVDVCLRAMGESEPPPALAARLADGLVFSNLVGRSSVIAEAGEEGIAPAALGIQAGPEFADAGILFEGAPFDLALRFLRQKVPAPTTGSRDLDALAHDRAFAVAGETDRAVLADIRRMIDDAFTRGTGYEGFRAGFDALIASGKWTGDDRLAAEPGRRAWRAHTIWHTNLTTAHAAGRRRQQLDLVRVLPFWQYRHAATRTPKRPRTEHIVLDGLTLPADDPTWGRLYAPNGYLCSCAIRAITRAKAERAHPNHRVPPDEGKIGLAVPHEWQHAPGTTAEWEGW